MDNVFAQLLIAASLVMAGHQDIRERAVSDLVWTPALAGGVLAVVLLPSGLVILLLKLGLVGGVGLVFARLGFVGQADAIALVAVTLDPAPLAPVPALLATALIAIGHISYLFLRGYVGKPRTITVRQFRSEARWIPKALIRDGVREAVDRDVNVSRESVYAALESGEKETDTVEVQYGVPTVAYIAAGYVVFLLYELVFQPSLLMSLA